MQSSSYLGVDFSQDALTVPSQYCKQGVLEAQHRQHHQSRAAHALKVALEAGNAGRAAGHDGEGVRHVYSMQW